MRGRDRPFRPSTAEYRFHRYLGVGAFAEYATKELDEWSFGLPLFLHPWRGLRIQAALGLDLKHGDTEFLFRPGMGCGVELSERWRLLPEVNVDFVDGEQAVIYGVSFGYAW